MPFPLPSPSVSYWDLNGSNDLYNTNLSGKVGIGTNAPGDLLTVKGIRPRVQIDDGQTERLRLGGNGDGGMWWANNLNFDGTNWIKDDIARMGLLELLRNDSYGGTPRFEWLMSVAGANPAVLVSQMNLSAVGLLLGYNGTTNAFFKLDVIGDIRVQSSNKLYFGGTGASDNDVDLYRSASDTLKTDDKFECAEIKLNDNASGTKGVTFADGTRQSTAATSDATALRTILVPFSYVNMGGTVDSTATIPALARVLRAALLVSAAFTGGSAPTAAVEVYNAGGSTPLQTTADNNLGVADQYDVLDMVSVPTSRGGPVRITLAGTAGVGTGEVLVEYSMPAA